MSERLAQRNAEIERRLISGETQNAVAQSLGITRQRVSQVVGARPLVPAGPIRAAVEATGEPRRALAARYAARFGVTEGWAYRLLLELQWRPTLRETTADQVLTLIGRQELLEGSYA